MTMRYEITRSNRKTIVLKVKSDGKLEVAAPNEATNKDIENIVNKKKFGFIKLQIKLKRKLRSL